MTSLHVPIRLMETEGVSHRLATVRTGVPFPRGQVDADMKLAIVDGSGRRLPAEWRTMAVWPDGSIKWVLVDLLHPMAAREQCTVHLVRDAADFDDAAKIDALVISEGPAEFRIDSGAAVFALSKSGSRLVRDIRIAGKPMLGEEGIRLLVRDAAGQTHEASIDAAVVNPGALRCEIKVSGTFKGGSRPLPLRFSATLALCAGSGHLAFEVTLWNPRAARHRGGLWDLGDPGSVLLSDCTLVCTSAAPPSGLAWHADPQFPDQTLEAGPWTLYQDSSGGENWQSPNHVDAAGRQTVRFRGFEVLAGKDRHPVAAGNRATPGVRLDVPGGWLAVSCPRFWQEFPKALRQEASRLEVGLFPAESGQRYELQGGERKRHAVWLMAGGVAAPDSFRECRETVCAAVDAQWLAASKAIAWIAAPDVDDDPRYAGYINAIIDGPHSVFTKREIIDEYGWRNFGDLYADHEAVRHAGPTPFISHYNNQYDFVLGAGRNFARTGDPRWLELMRDAAHHVMDIDIYHTVEDKPDFNGGLFWHTDHYRPAATCTHRTYSRGNAAGGPYGGGPSNEHDYSSGLLLYSRLTGDDAAAKAVIELADWVVAMDDGSRTILALVDASPTGSASATVDPDFHGPGRGAGNSINTLIDAYSLSGKRMYLAKAEEILQRCVHPDDDLPALHLDQPEHRWSYLVFLQVAGKYLDLKEGLGEFDYAFYYARDSLLHYARWVREHERPYKELLDRVEIPTETWPAHDIRKAHVLYIASRFVEVGEAGGWLDKADAYHDRCIADLLSFPTAYLTRPQVLMSVYGQVKSYYRSPSWLSAVDPNCRRRHVHDFGRPAHFVPQRRRLRQAIRRKFDLVLDELARRAGRPFGKA